MSFKDHIHNISLIKDKCFINGQWVGDPSIKVINPADQKILGAVPEIAEDDVKAAIKAAKEALKPWSQAIPKKREEILKKWHHLILENKNDLAKMMTLEQGKPLAEAKGEIDYAASFIQFYAEEAKRIKGEILEPFIEGSQPLVMRQPIGVVCAITPWNFPAAMITRKVAPALAAGCSIVIKPSEETPFSAFALAYLAEQAGMPKGVLNMVTGNAKAIGKIMCAHEDVRFIGFTGSTKVGAILMEQAAPTIKKVGLELGGNAPFIVFEDAHLEEAIEGAVICKYRNAGQTCVCANRFLVHESLYNDFVKGLSERVRKLKVGNGLKEGVQIGPLISEEGVLKVEKHIQDAVAKGAKIECGGIKSKKGKQFFEPTVLSNVSLASIISYEETFGPVAPVFKFQTEDEAIKRANETSMGLAAYFYTRDMARIMRVSKTLEYGMVGVNTGLLSSQTVPFGGIKQSGIGREGGHHGIEEFTELKYTLLAGL